jgi:hypothetical protein
MGDQALDLVSALATARQLPETAPDAVFFDLAGHHLLSYAPAAGWLILLIAVAGLAGACVLVRRAGVLSTSGVITGVVSFLWLAAHGLLLLVVFNLVSGSAAHPNYYDRLAALPRLEAQAVLACLCALVAWLGLRRPGKRALGLVPGVVLFVFGWALGGTHMLLLSAAIIGMLTGWFVPAAGVSRWGGWIGAIGILLFVAILLQIKAPMEAWIVAWPVMILSIAAVLVAWVDARLTRPWSYAIAAVALAAVTAPLIPLAHLAFLGIGAPLPETMLAFLLIVAAAAWPLAKIERAGRTTLLIAGALLVAGLAIAVQVRIDPIAETIPAYSLDK